MTEKTWQDCHFLLDRDQVVLENCLLSTHWQLTPSGLALCRVENRATGFCWQDHPVLPLCMTVSQTPRWEIRTVEDGLTAPHWQIRCLWESTLERSFLLYPGCPFLTTSARWIDPDPRLFSKEVSATPQGLELADAQNTGLVPGDVMMAVPLPNRHLRWRSIRFFDQTDVHDTLIREQTALVYSREDLELSGSILTVEDGEEVLLCARHAPVTPAGVAQFRIKDCVLSILENGKDFNTAGCSCVIGIGLRRDICRSYREFYRLGWQAPWQNQALLLSNTWGDRSRDSRVTDPFIRQEIRQAARIGLDVVQIDDGWQKGATINSATASGGVWEGYYATQADFWKPHPVRFPEGLVPLIQYAASFGIHLGLWFSPDSSQSFAHWHQDVQTVLHYFSLGITVFKLDGVNLTTAEAHRNYQSFLSEVTRRSEGHIILQQDITAQQRMGYFSRRELGTLFVENRYTDFHNYFPHRTLRNLWMVSQWIPSQRLLFELLNNRRNPDLYRGDALAPECYSIDYLFASVMVSQPLFWMELSGLSEEQLCQLEPIIRVFRQYRKEIWNCDVQPVGQEPDGSSFPGFLLSNVFDQGNSGFLLMFRENTPQKDCVLDLPISVCPISSGQPDCTFTREGTSIRIRFPKPRSFTFCRWHLYSPPLHPGVSLQNRGLFSSPNRVGG